jgi:hypothetical protein
MHNTDCAFATFATKTQSRLWGAGPIASLSSFAGLAALRETSSDFRCGSAGLRKSANLMNEAAVSSPQHQMRIGFLSRMQALTTRILGRIEWRFSRRE